MGDIKNKMKDIILIVKYNYAEHLGSVGFLKDLYQDHFKKIIFYSDIGENKHQQDEVNFVETKKGAYTQNIFWHAWNNYQEDIVNADGLFYTMDDCILNTSELKNIKEDKAIFSAGEKTVRRSLPDIENRWQWGRRSGKHALGELERSEQFKNLQINGYTGCYADYFYMPKKYLTPLFFERMKAFGDFKVWLEIAIPSVIHNTVKQEDYMRHNFLAMWRNRQPLKNKESFLNLFTKDSEADKKINFQEHWGESFKNLAIHPIKLSKEKYRDWLSEIA